MGFNPFKFFTKNRNESTQNLVDSWKASLADVYQEIGRLRDSNLSLASNMTESLAMATCVHYTNFMEDLRKVPNLPIAALYNAHAVHTHRVLQEFDNLKIALGVVEDMVIDGDVESMEKATDGVKKQFQKCLSRVNDRRESFVSVCIEESAKIKNAIGIYEYLSERHRDELFKEYVVIIDTLELAISQSHEPA